MSKVTIALTALSTVVLLVTFGKGMSILHGGDVASHMYWSMAALLSALTANFVAMVPELVVNAEFTSSQAITAPPSATCCPRNSASR